MRHTCVFTEEQYKEVQNILHKGLEYKPKLILKSEVVLDNSNISNRELKISTTINDEYLPIIRKRCFFETDFFESDDTIFEVLFYPMTPEKVMELKCKDIFSYITTNSNYKRFDEIECNIDKEDILKYKNKSFLNPDIYFNELPNVIDNLEFIPILLCDIPILNKPYDVMIDMRDMQVKDMYKIYISHHPSDKKIDICTIKNIDFKILKDYGKNIKEFLNIVLKDAFNYKPGFVGQNILIHKLLRGDDLL